ncbi:MAG TPA: hypothetical protein VHJ78_12425, partial [Actinomycetota bacterium]|nr:hypothetical protein [Actinomycetota bacterium]
VLLAVWAVALVSEMDQRLQPAPTFVGLTPEPAYMLSSKHGPVTNIYPYAPDGTPLEGVLLFDQDGRPLRTETQLWWADRCQRQPAYPRAADGGLVEFAYPKSYQLGQVLTGQQCQAEVPRPPVPLPTFPPEGPAPGAPAEQAATTGPGPEASPRPEVTPARPA